MIGFAVLLAFNLLGYVLQEVLHLPLPGNVTGLILFVLCLYLKWIKLEWVEQASQFLLSNMLVFFAPVIVGVIAVYPVLKGNILPVAVGLVGSTLIGLLAAGMVTKALMSRETTE